jgi:predicted  nucleic acid-binding Zn-ribbon protein
VGRIHRHVRQLNEEIRAAVEAKAATDEEADEFMDRVAQLEGERHRLVEEFVRLDPLFSADQN